MRDVQLDGADDPVAIGDRGVPATTGHHRTQAPGDLLGSGRAASFPRITIEELIQFLRR